MRRFRPATDRSTCTRAGWRGAIGIAVVAGIAVTGCGSSSSSKTSTPAASGSASSTSSASSSTCPASSGPGVSKSTVDIAVVVISLSGGSLSNATIGVPSVQEQKDDWNLVADSINKSGVACRKLALHFFNANPIDANATQQTCLNIVASRPFLALDTGSLTQTGASDCIPARKIPLASTTLTAAQLDKYKSYYLLVSDIPNNTVRNGTLGLKQLGFFDSSKGFSKLGFLYHSCNPSLVTVQRNAFKEAGISDDKIVSLNLGCPAGQVDTPASLEQAVLKFKNAGVTNVTETGVADFGAFTHIAQQQNFKPKYGLADDGAASVTVAKGQNAVDTTNFDGALDVVTSGYGEQSTPGYQPSGATKKCDALFTAAGKPSVYKQDDGYGGVACAYLTFVQALLNHAPKLQASSLIDGMHNIGTLDLSYPSAPIDFSAAPAGSGYGISYWRAITYHASCNCWQVPDPTFHAPFK